jgi:iron complex transport system ATP-binding protein
LIKIEGLNHLILKIDKLEIDGNCVILGPNGSGKSILMRVINHEIYPHKITKREVFGSKLTLNEARKIFGTVNSELEYFYKQENISVFDAIISAFKEALVVYNFFEFDETEKRRVFELCETFKLSPKSCVCDLSLGEIKKLLIARAIIHDPEILCLDEPTNGLDIKAKSLFWDVIEELNKKIILVTHDFNEAAIYSNIIMLKNGEIFKTAKTLKKEDIIKLFDINENIYRRFYG